MIGRRMRKRKPSYHQKQMLFFTVLFGTLLVLVVAGLLWILNSQPTPWWVSFSGR
jgi:thiosulfate reductase cytochrome b subunit